MIKGSKQKGKCRNCGREYSTWKNKNSLCSICQLSDRKKRILAFKNVKKRGIYNRKLLEFCEDTPKYVGEIAKFLKISPASVSEKIKKLEEQDLIVIDRKGKGKKTFVKRKIVTEKQLKELAKDRAKRRVNLQKQWENAQPRRLRKQKRIFVPQGQFALNPKTFLNPYLNSSLKADFLEETKKVILSLTIEDFNENRILKAIAEINTSLNDFYQIFNFPRGTMKYNRDKNKN